MYYLIYVQNTMGENESKLLTIEGSQQTGWRSHTVCVPAGTYSIGFVASVGMSRKPYIGVDEVKPAGPCISNLNTTGDRLTQTYKSVGPLHWVQTFPLPHSALILV